MKRVAAILILSAAAPAIALDLPTHSPYDHRVRNVVYNPDDVVQIDAVVGTATHVILEPGEELMTHAFGDSQAYQFATHQNHLFLKPAADDANTNLAVVTNRRTYAFRLSFTADRRAQALYTLRFSYPDNDRARAAEAQTRAQVAADLQTTSSPVSWEGYQFFGNATLVPRHAWNDGHTTWFQFGPGRELPAIYAMDASGQERLVNQHVESSADGRVVLHTTSARWVLRLGESAAGVEDTQHGVIAARPTLTRTVSDQVRRVVKDEFQ
ncbi:P-type conjugative transfer protein VirB9 [Achromobacter sp. GG226]|uniref:P-type conjugative transfer protein VirB9 n=1 Tax=Verticiella alkaliphila TaxID=2779529 RepID=UPI001C0C8FB5|nr:P-type conjugative transfer protein VirB9 [Verticiella sp. GG226]MBU4610313.1 P-type conjugative transfer protein VirB9 [Verticiella sp. GG226]